MFDHVDAHVLAIEAPPKSFAFGFGLNRTKTNCVKMHMKLHYEIFVTALSVFNRLRKVVLTIFLENAECLVIVNWHSLDLEVQQRARTEKTRTLISASVFIVN